MSILNRFLLVLKILTTVLVIPIECSSDCYYTTYYREYVCYYSKYSSSSYGGTIAAAVFGSIGGFIFISFVVVFVCFVCCKKTNHGQVVVKPHPTVSYTSSEQHMYPVPPTEPSCPQPAVYNAPPSYSSFNTYNSHPPTYATQSAVSNEQTGTQLSNPT